MLKRDLCHKKNGVNVSALYVEPELDFLQKVMSGICHVTSWF